MSNFNSISAFILIFWFKNLFITLFFFFLQVLNCKQPLMWVHVYIVKPLVTFLFLDVSIVSLMIFDSSAFNWCYRIFLNYLITCETDSLFLLICSYGSANVLDVKQLITRRHYKSVTWQQLIHMLWTQKPKCKCFSEKWVYSDRIFCFFIIKIVLWQSLT